MMWLVENAALIGLLFFFCVFVGIILWALQPQRKQVLESYKHIPFMDEADDSRF